jgi:hypothetical protein
VLARDPQRSGPVLAHLKIRTGTLAELPRPGIAPADVARRLVRHIRK